MRPASEGRGRRLGGAAKRPKTKLKIIFVFVSAAILHALQNQVKTSQNLCRKSHPTPRATTTPNPNARPWLLPSASPSQSHLAPNKPRLPLFCQADKPNQHKRPTKKPPPHGDGKPHRAVCCPVLLLQTQVGAFRDGSALAQGLSRRRPPGWPPLERCWGKTGHCGITNTAGYFSYTTIFCRCVG